MRMLKCIHEAYPRIRNQVRTSDCCSTSVIVVRTCLQLLYELVCVNGHEDVDILLSPFLSPFSPYSFQSSFLIFLFHPSLQIIPLSDEEWQSTAVDFYYQDVQRIAKSRAVPSNVDMIRLSSLKNFLNCNDVSVAKVSDCQKGFFLKFL